MAYNSLYEIQMSVSTNKLLLEQSPVICMLSVTAKADFSSCKRPNGPKSLKDLLSGSSEKKFADPCFVICFLSIVFILY